MNLDVKTLTDINNVAISIKDSGELDRLMNEIAILIITKLKEAGIPKYISNWNLHPSVSLIVPNVISYIANMIDFKIILFSDEWIDNCKGED